MSIYYTKIIDESCGRINLGLSRTYMDIYNALLNGEAVEMEPTHAAYLLNKDYAHVRTSKFPADNFSKRRLDTEIIRGHILDAYARMPVNTFEDIAGEYSQFQIPKRTGGFRTIDAPSERLKIRQQQIVHALTYDLGLHAHEAAHAYVKGRSPKTSLEVHQANKSKWFLKLDIKDFFPSCTKEFVFHQLDKLYPICIFTDEQMETSLQLCFLNGALPQGAVTSPLLSNLTMLPIDFAMRQLREEFHQIFAYTRYADDILISSEFDFDYRAVETFIATEIFKDTPFKIKHEKTRYGSIAGQNWNLGLMLNKDNNITVGSQRKTELKHAIFNLLMDYTKGIAWSTEDKLHLRGIYSYIHNIEPAYAQGIITYYENKTGASWKDAISTATIIHDTPPQELPRLTLEDFIVTDNEEGVPF